MSTDGAEGPPSAGSGPLLEPKRRTRWQRLFPVVLFLLLISSLSPYRVTSKGAFGLFTSPVVTAADTDAMAQLTVSKGIPSVTVIRRLGPFWIRHASSTVPLASTERPLSRHQYAVSIANGPEGLWTFAGEVLDERVTKLRADTGEIQLRGRYYLMLKRSTMNQVNFTAQALDRSGRILYRIGPETNMDWVPIESVP